MSYLSKHKISLFQSYNPCYLSLYTTYFAQNISCPQLLGYILKKKTTVYLKKKTLLITFFKHST